ncbi:hypothetical protein [Streptomyces sp. NPDC048106]|uniref:hypothetical protein n=1 Tax=Streptomyces sp. NPDC048106 TaxID=3155750 RepID=UPI0034528AC5
MTDKQRNAPSRPRSRHSSGVTHVNEPHYDNFTVVDARLYGRRAAKNRAARAVAVATGEAAE